jgi:hypothetical protein
LELDGPAHHAVLLAMKTDLEEGSPAGRLYGESLTNALAPGAALSKPG